MSSTDDFLKFGQGLRAGAKQAAEGMLEDVVDLAKLGHGIATDSKVRDQAWQAVRTTSGNVLDYGEAAVKDPAKPWRDAKILAAKARASAQEFQDSASPEDWGKLVGGGGVQVGSMFVGVGVASKLGKAAKIVKLEKNTGKLVDSVNGAKGASKKFPDQKPCATTLCPAKGQAIVASKKKLLLRDDLDPKFFEENGSLKWPSNDGFAGPIKVEPLKKGTLIDRWTHPKRVGEFDGGNFFSPVGTPFDARSLPYDAGKMELTKYRVLRDIPNTRSGEIAKAFDQGGGGIQFQTPEGMSVQKLLGDGYIEVVK